MTLTTETPRTVCHNPETPIPSPAVDVPPRAYDLSDEAFQTQGVRRNNDRIFNLPFYGREIHFVLKILDRLAEQSDLIVNIRPAVLAAEMFRERAKERGF